MYKVWIIERDLSRPMPRNSTALPKTGRVVDSGPNLLDDDNDGLFNFEKAWERAIDFNETELKSPKGYWAVVLRDDVELTTGQNVNLEQGTTINIKNLN